MVGTTELKHHSKILVTYSHFRTIPKNVDGSEHILSYIFLLR